MITFYKKTQAQYDALSTYENDGIYFITDSKVIYLIGVRYGSNISVVTEWPAAGLVGILYVHSTTEEMRIFKDNNWVTVQSPKTSTVSISSTDNQIPTAKAVFDYVGDAVVFVGTALFHRDFLHELHYRVQFVGVSLRLEVLVALLQPLHNAGGLLISLVDFRNDPQQGGYDRMQVFQRVRHGQFLVAEYRSSELHLFEHLEEYVELDILENILVRSHRIVHGIKLDGEVFFFIRLEKFVQECGLSGSEFSGKDDPFVAGKLQVFEEFRFDMICVYSCSGHGVTILYSTS